MYFSIGPKTNKEDLFHFEKEYMELKTVLKSENRLIILKGLRRTGKTSLLKTLFQELKFPKLFIDAREIESLSEKGVYSFFHVAFLGVLKQKNPLASLFDSLESIEIGITLNLREKRPILSSITKEIQKIIEKENSFFYIFIDEAQMLKASGFDNFIAFLIDSFPNFKIVLAGSEIGLLDEFTGEEADSALYGRAKAIIHTGKFSRDEALEFLKRGFAQKRKSFVSEDVEEALNTLNGTAGWLNLYGFYVLTQDHKFALARVKKEGAKITKNELDRFFSYRLSARNSYLAVLSALSAQSLSWSQIKTFITIKLKKNVADSKLSKYLNSLIDYGFLEKKEHKYRLSDPLIKEALLLY